MTTKEYLRRPYDLSKAIKREKKQYDSIDNLIKGTTIVISGLPHSATPNPHRFESMMAKALDLDMEIQRLEVAFSNAVVEVTDAINSINNPACEDVLRLRYLDFMDWTSIARKLDYSVDWVFRLHRKGLNLIKMQ